MDIISTWSPLQVGLKCVLKGMHKRKETTIEWTKVQRVYFGMKLKYHMDIAIILHLAKKYAWHKIGVWWKTFHEWKLVKKRQKKKESFKDENRSYVVKCLFKQDNYIKWCVTLWPCHVH
jgi:hypothetical protein